MCKLLIAAGVAYAVYRFSRGNENGVISRTTETVRQLAAGKNGQEGTETARLPVSVPLDQDGRSGIALRALANGEKLYAQKHYAGARDQARIAMGKFSYTDPKWQESADLLNRCSTRILNGDGSSRETFVYTVQRGDSYSRIGAGPMMIFGLYSRFGNTTGAFSSLISGMVLSLFFIFCQRNWADLVYPWLEANELHIPVGNFLATCSAPFEPWIVWRMAAHKFPINSMEINFIIMLSSLFFYIAGSLVTYKGPFNLDRMLHRGIYNTGEYKQPPFHWSFRNAFKKIIGITPEYSTGDKVISWSVFIYSFIYKFLITFVLVVLWNIFSPWKLAWWGHYFFIVYLGVPLASAFVTSIWFFVGGVIDIRRLFRDLAARVDNPLDNGQVEGNVAISDIAAFSDLNKDKKEEKETEK